MSHTYRVGQIVPSSNVTMETEIPAILRARETIEPERFTFHSSRMRMTHVTPEQLKAMDTDSDRCAVELSDAHVDVLSYACLVAIMSMGLGYHRASEHRLRGPGNPGQPRRRRARPEAAARHRQAPGLHPGRRRHPVRLRTDALPQRHRGGRTTPGSPHGLLRRLHRTPDTALPRPARRGPGRRPPPVRHIRRQRAALQRLRAATSKAPMALGRIEPVASRHAQAAVTQVADTL